MAQKRTLFIVHVAFLGAVQFTCGCGEDVSTTPTMSGIAECAPGQSRQCNCPDGTTVSQPCPATYTYGACPCSTAISTAGRGGNGGDGGFTAGAGAAGARIGNAGRTGSGGKIIAFAGAGGRATGSGASAGAGGKSGASTGAAGKLNTSTDDLNAARQLCVDTINQLRATESLKALKRAAPEVEACSDQGAAADGKSQVAHQSARNGWKEFPGCAQYKTWPSGALMGGQDACPNWTVGGNVRWGGFATVGDALANCLQMMWDEKKTFVATGLTREQCQADQSATGCFMTNGHYLNMSSTSYTTVSCGFANLGNNTWWMNQDF
jgi:hypothetical protein